MDDVLKRSMGTARPLRILQACTIGASNFLLQSTSSGAPRSIEQRRPSETTAFMTASSSISC